MQIDVIQPTNLLHPSPTCIQSPFFDQEAPIYSYLNRINRHAERVGNSLPPASCLQALDTKARPIRHKSSRYRSELLNLHESLPFMRQHPSIIGSPQLESPPPHPLHASSKQVPCGAFYHSSHSVRPLVEK